MALALGVAMQEVMRLYAKSLALTTTSNLVSKGLTRKLAYLHREMSLAEATMGEAMRTVKAIGSCGIDPTMNAAVSCVLESQGMEASPWTEVYRQALILTTFSDAKRISIQFRSTGEDPVEVAQLP
jgi:hypothetical protein